MSDTEKPMSYTKGRCRDNGSFNEPHVCQNSQTAPSKNGVHICKETHFAKEVLKLQGELKVVKEELRGAYGTIGKWSEDATKANERWEKLKAEMKVYINQGHLHSSPTVTEVFLKFAQETLDKMAELEKQ